VIAFKGQVTPEVLADFKRLYLRGNWPVRLCYAGFGVAMLYIMFSWSRRDPTVPTWSYGFSSVFAVVFFVVAARIHHVWWWWWLRYYQPNATPFLDGVVAEDGFHLMDQVIAWSSLTGAKVDSECFLLYTSKWFVQPVHRSMFGSQSAWLEAAALVRRKVPAWKTLLGTGATTGAA
jgi:hypothetical protein